MLLKYAAKVGNFAEILHSLANVEMRQVGLLQCSHYTAVVNA